MNYWETIGPCQSPLGILDWLLSLMGIQIFSPYENPRTSYCRSILSAQLHIPGGAPLADYLLIFGVTFLLELLFYIAAARYTRASNHWIFRNPILFCLMANLATHPIVIFVMPDLGSWMNLSEGGIVLMSESFAIGVEAGVIGWLTRLRPVKAFLFSLGANLTSWSIGPYFLLEIARFL